jgi:hypothetical protein
MNALPVGSRQAAGTGRVGVGAHIVCSPVKLVIGMMMERLTLRHFVFILVAPYVPW